MKLDFKDFKKIECDGKCTTLQHPSGHQIKIARKGLSEEHKKELDDMPIAMAKGGYAKFSQKFDPNIKGSESRVLPKMPGYTSNSQGKVVPTKGSRSSGPSKSSNTMPQSQELAKNTYTEPQDQGTDVVLAALHREAPPFGPTTAKYHSPPCINPSCKSYGRPHPNCRCYGGKLDVGRGGMMNQASYAEGGEVKSYCDMKMPHQKGCAYFKDGGISRGMGDDDTSPQKDLSQSYDFEDPSIVSSQPQGPPATSPGVYSDIVNQNPEASSSSDELNPTNSPIIGQSPQEQNQPQPEATENNNPPPEQQTPQSIDPSLQNFTHDKSYANNLMSQEQTAWEGDLNKGIIKPETYKSLFDKQDTVGKIGTLFGLMLSGVGSGMAHQDNAVMHMMDQTINNDLKAQETNATNKHSFMTINQQNLSNMANVRHTDALTKALKYPIAYAMASSANLHNLVQYANNLPEGPLKQQYQTKLAALAGAVKDKQMGLMDQASTQYALYNKMFDQQNGQPNTMALKAGFFGPEGEKIGQDTEQKTLNGVVSGTANRPMTEEDKKELTNKHIYDAAAQQYLDYANKSKNNWANLNLKDRAAIANKGAAMGADLQGKYRNKSHGGVYKEGEQNFIESIIPSQPAKWSAGFDSIPKVEQTIKDNAIEANGLANSYGVKYIPGNKQAQQSGPQIKTVKGIKYRRGPNGEAIRVE